MANHPNRSASYQTHRIKGDWMQDGYLDNLNRQRALDVAVYGPERAYAMEYGQPDQYQRLTIDGDGHIRAWGAGVAFSPDDGELTRVGLLELPRYRT